MIQCCLSYWKPWYPVVHLDQTTLNQSRFLRKGRTWGETEPKWESSPRRLWTGTYNTTPETNKLGEIQVSQIWEGQQEPIQNQHCQTTANSIKNRQAASNPREQRRYKHSMLKFPLAGINGLCPWCWCNAAIRGTGTDWQFGDSNLQNHKCKHTVALGTDSLKFKGPSTMEE